MIALADVIARLSNALVPATLQSVKPLGDLSAALDQFTGGPSAWVMPTEDRAGPDTAGTMEVRQRVTQGFAVLIGFGNIGPTAGAQLDNIDIVRAAVRASLIGWLPNDSVEPLRYARGRVVHADFDRQLIFWAEEFAGTYFVRSA